MKDDQYQRPEAIEDENTDTDADAENTNMVSDYALLNKRTGTFILLKQKFHPVFSAVR